MQVHKYLQLNRIYFCLTISGFQRFIKMPPSYFSVFVQNDRDSRVCWTHSENMFQSTIQNVQYVFKIIVELLGSAQVHSISNIYHDSTTAFSVFFKTIEIGDCYGLTILGDHRTFIFSKKGGFPKCWDTHNNIVFNEWVVFVFSERSTQKCEKY